MKKYICVAVLGWGLSCAHALERLPDIKGVVVKRVEREHSLTSQVMWHEVRPSITSACFTSTTTQCPARKVSGCIKLPVIPESVTGEGFSGKEDALCALASAPSLTVSMEGRSSSEGDTKFLSKTGPLSMSTSVPSSCEISGQAGGEVSLREADLSCNAITFPQRGGVRLTPIVRSKNLESAKTDSSTRKKKRRQSASTISLSAVALDVS